MLHFTANGLRQRTGSHQYYIIRSEAVHACQLLTDLFNNCFLPGRRHVTVKLLQYNHLLFLSGIYRKYCSGLKSAMEGLDISLQIVRIEVFTADDQQILDSADNVQRSVP
ncbi:hypothetical protein D3C73_1195620 [compost metagenome]